jgi:hypothetical protein
VRFADGQLPESVSLVLVVDSVRAQSHVTVPRRPGEAQGCEGALASARALVAARDAELDALKEELRDRAGSLTELVATGVLTGAGIRVVALPGRQWVPSRMLDVTATRLHVALGRMAVEVEVKLKSQVRRKRSWAPGPVKLMLNGTPVAVRSVRLLGGPLLKTADKARLMVEWMAPEADPERPPPPYALEVSEQGGRDRLFAPCLGSGQCKTKGTSWQK